MEELLQYLYPIHDAKINSIDLSSFDFNAQCTYTIITLIPKVAFICADTQQSINDVLTAYKKYAVDAQISVLDNITVLILIQ